MWYVANEFGKVSGRSQIADKIVCTCRQVNGDCCNDSNQHCAAGVPTTCDAKCAITYNAYYTECAQQITASFSPQQQSQFAELYVSVQHAPILSRVILQLTEVTTRFMILLGGPGTTRAARCLSNRCLTSWQQRSSARRVWGRRINQSARTAGRPRYVVTIRLSRNFDWYSD